MTSPSPLSPSLTSRLGVFTIALLYTLFTFGIAVAPAPAQAKAKLPYYTAELAQPASEARFIGDGIVWRCAGTKCRAAKSHSRPIRICRSLQRKFGEIVAFSAKGEALAADKLAKCNGK